MSKATSVTIYAIPSADAMVSCVGDSFTVSRTPQRGSDELSEVLKLRRLPRSHPSRPTILEMLSREKPRH